MATGAGLAKWKQTHGKKKLKVCLDINRPSHGRTYPVEGNSPGISGIIPALMAFASGSRFGPFKIVGPMTPPTNTLLGNTANPLDMIGR